jgi:hypothetical protein
MIAGTAAIVILIGLSGMHVYWAAGGKAGRTGTIPSLSERPVLKPTPATTTAVAFGLAAMAAWLGVGIGWPGLPAFPALHLLVQAGVWLMAAVFALRAVGDFRYVGFFKSVRDSRFARLDTMFYSPLCICLALLTGISAITSR